MDGASGIAAQGKFNYGLEQIGTVSSLRGRPYQRTWPSRDISDHKQYKRVLSRNRCDQQICDIE
jgi:hypothetical protein